jgi:hypothetical protein
MPRVLLLITTLAVATVAGCGVPESSMVAVGPGIEVPAEELRPVDKCMYDAGFRATEIHRGRSGSNGAYSWDVPTTFGWEATGEGATMAAMSACGNQFGSRGEKTIEEVREIYDRWVLERECLIGLGFQPASPPPFGDFVGQWRTGPWMPVDGVPYTALGDAAKEQCGLEMLD